MRTGFKNTHSKDWKGQGEQGCGEVYGIAGVGVGESSEGGTEMEEADVPAKGVLTEA